jgi:hypothetical protein
MQLPYSRPHEECLPWLLISLQNITERRAAVKSKRDDTKPVKIFLAQVLRSKHEDVGVFASSEAEAKKKIIALYEDKGIDVLHLKFMKKSEESCDKSVEVPTTENSTPK